MIIHWFILFQDPKEKPVKKKASLKPPDLVKQPSIKQFFNNKKTEALETNDDQLDVICKDIDKINLQPKKLVLTTKTSKDMVRLLFMLFRIMKLGEEIRYNILIIPERFDSTFKLSLSNDQ